MFLSRGSEADGRFTATKEFTVATIAQDGSRCTVTTTAPHGIPRNETVTLTDCGAFTGDQTTSAAGGTYDATRFNFLTSTFTDLFSVCLLDGISPNIDVPTLVIIV